MTTKNPRLTITLQPTLAAQLRRLSALTGSSQSALISELLDGSTHVFDRVIRVLEASESIKESIKGRATADMDAAQKRIEAQFDLVMGEFDNATLPLLDEAESIKRRSRRGVGGGVLAPLPLCDAGGAPTPLSNRGVRYTKPTTEKIAIAQTPARGNSLKSRGKVGGVEK